MLRSRSEKETLQRRLAAWDNTLAKDTFRTDRRGLRWIQYTAAVGSALAMVTDAAAGSIKYSGIQDVTAGENQIAQFSVGPASFLISALSNLPYGVGVFLTAGNIAGILVNGSDGVRKLASGAAISAGAGNFQAGFHTVKASSGGGGTGGTFNASQPGLAGIRFNTGTFLNPMYHYGWVRLEYTGTPSPDSITAIDWAYETAVNEKIAAGQTTELSSAPEPGTIAMSLLALGAAGVLALRRKRIAVSSK